MLMTQVQYWANQEIKRHNLRTEELTDFSNREIQRHNMKSESQTDWYNAEVKRHNIASEGIGWRQAQAAMMSANAALSQAAAAHRQADTAQFRAELIDKLDILMQQVNLREIKRRPIYLKHSKRRQLMILD